MLSANIDFYSGFCLRYAWLTYRTVYLDICLLGLIVGWALRIEELINTDKIIRPGYMAVKEHEEYVEMTENKNYPIEAAHENEPRLKQP